MFYSIVSCVCVTKQVWFKNRRAKCRQIQKAGEQQQQVVNSVLVKNSNCASQLGNGSTLAGGGASSSQDVKQRSSASACSSTDSPRGDDSPQLPANFNTAPAVTGPTGNSCSRSPTSGAELDRTSGDGSAPSVSPPAGPALYYNLPSSPSSPSSVLLPPARPSCLAANAMWHSASPHNVISCNGVGYRQAPGNAGPSSRGVANYGTMVMSPNGSGFYSNHAPGAALVGSGYGYGDVGGTGAPYGYHGNGVGAVEQWQWTTSMTRSYCTPGAVDNAVLGCGPQAGQPGSVRYGGMDVVGSYLPQSHVRQLAELSDNDVDDRKDWYRFHAL